ncbi:MAG: YadA C-terminal domain-containing protein, partial [Porticoccaceae bacterium]
TNSTNISNTQTSVATNSTNISTNTTDIATNTAAIQGLDKRIDRLDDKASRGIAIANAMEVFLPDPGKSFRMTVGGGFYGGQQAIGLTGSGRVTEDTAVYFGIGTDVSGLEFGGKVGVSFQW